MRSLVLAAAFLPYAFFTLKDGMLHMGKRKVRAVSLAEHLLHFILIVPIAWMVAGVFQGDAQVAAVGLLLFLPPALVDELVFHRDLPLVETDAHAKGHLTLLLFLGVGALSWLDAHAGDLGLARVVPWR